MILYLPFLCAVNCSAQLLHLTAFTSGLFCDRASLIPSQRSTIIMSKMFSISEGLKTMGTILNRDKKAKKKGIQHPGGPSVSSSQREVHVDATGSSSTRDLDRIYHPDTSNALLKRKAIGNPGHDRDDIERSDREAIDMSGNTFVNAVGRNFGQNEDERVHPEDAKTTVARSNTLKFTPAIDSTLTQFGRNTNQFYEDLRTVKTFEDIPLLLKSASKMLGSALNLKVSHRNFYFSSHPFPSCRWRARTKTIGIDSFRHLNFISLFGHTTLRFSKRITNTRRKINLITRRQMTSETSLLTLSKKQSLSLNHTLSKKNL